MGEGEGGGPVDEQFTRIHCNTVYPVLDLMNGREAGCLFYILRSDVECKA